jgi:hypothetical protein
MVNVVNSFAAVKQLLTARSKTPITLDTIRDAMRKNFKGYESMRARALVGVRVALCVCAFLQRRGRGKPKQGQILSSVTLRRV